MAFLSFRRTSLRLCNFIPSLQIEQDVIHIFLHAFECEYSCSTPEIFTSVGA